MTFLDCDAIMTTGLTRLDQQSADRPRRLLIATGGSAHSEIALRTGLGLAQQMAAPHGASGPVQVTLLSVARTRAAQATAEQILARAAEDWRPAGLMLRQEVRQGNPVDEILAALAAEPVDLLILGERSGHRLSTKLRGTLVERIVGRAPCSVLIVRESIATFARVLVCDSGVDAPGVVDTLRDRGLLALLAAEARVTVLHVMSQISAGPGVSGQPLRAGAQSLMEQEAREGQILTRDLAILTAAGLHTTAKIRHGLVVDEVIAESREGRYDLVVIGAHRTANWRGKLLDNLARKLLMGIARSVLLVKS